MSHELAAALQDPNGKPGCDFMGVNHYARSAVYHWSSPASSDHWSYCLTPTIESKPLLRKELQAFTLQPFQACQRHQRQVVLCRGVVGFFLNPTSKGPKGLADMGCEQPFHSSIVLLSYACILVLFAACEAFKPCSCTPHMAMCQSCGDNGAELCRPCVSTLPVPCGVLCVYPGRTSVHFGERHACQTGR